jgi:hypothetical protein
MEREGPTVGNVFIPFTEVTEIDELGDLTLIVGFQPGATRYLVSSTVLRLASPVWKAMLTGKFRESTARIIPFPDDCPLVLGTLLRLAHLQHNNIPKEMGFDDLVELAAICDKYDVLSIVRPYVYEWVQPWRKHLWTPGYEEWLYLAWVFGYIQDFIALAKRFCGEISIDEDGTCSRDGRCLDDDMVLMPPGIIGETPQSYLK